MKNKVAKGCLTFLLLYAGTTVFYFLILQFFSNNPYNPYLAPFGAIFGLLFIGSIKSIVVPGLEEKTIKKYQSRPVFEDGQYVAAIGPIQPTGKPLVSPLQKHKCVSYEYDIYKMVSTSHDSSHKKSDFIGFARTPSIVKTQAGQVKLTGYIDLDHFPKQDLKYNDIFQNAAEYISRTNFKNQKSGLREVLSEAGNIFEGRENNLLQELRNMPRSDRRDPDAELERNHSITERCVETGQEVCALGIYSSAAGALVSQSELEDRSQLIPGNAKQALALLKRKKYLLCLAGLSAFLISHGILYYMVRNFVQNPIL